MKRFCFTILGCLFLISSNAQGVLSDYSQPKLNEYALCSEGFNTGSCAGFSAQKAVFPKGYGFFGVINAGGTFALAEEESTSLMGLDIIGGYRLSYYTSVAVGVGYYNHSNKADSLNNLHSNIPIFFELRNHYSKNRISPYTTVNVGYAIKNGRASIPSKPQSGVIKGGPLVGVSVGVRYLITNTVGINLFAGYVGHKENIEEHYFENIETPSTLERPNFLHQLKFGVGVTF